MFPCLAIWWNAEGLLLAMHIDPIVARMSGAYLRLASLLLPGNFLYLLLSKYLQVQVQPEDRRGVCLTPCRAS